MSMKSKSKQKCLDKTICAFFDKYPKIRTADKIAIAVSGGPDSMALAHCLIHNFKKQIYIICVDHQLRTESKDESNFVEKWSQQFDPCRVFFKYLNWQGEKPNNAIMENARSARYDLMVNFCVSENIKTLFLGHHQDDQAETFLMRLTKGSGLDGLSSMQELKELHSVLLARPLLHHPKSDLIEYCQIHKILFSNDPSNENQKFMRPRLRKIMDGLADEGMTPKRLSLTAKRLDRARNALDTITKNTFDQILLDSDNNCIKLDFKNLKKHPEEIGLRVLKYSLEQFRPDAQYNVRMEKLEDLFEILWHKPQCFTARTLGGCKISLLNKGILQIEKET